MNSKISKECETRHLITWFKQSHNKEIADYTVACTDCTENKENCETYKLLNILEMLLLNVDVNNTIYNDVTQGILDNLKLGK